MRNANIPIFLACTLVTLGSADADSSANCMGEQPSPDVKIEACTKIIAEPGIDSDGKVRAWIHRGIGRYIKRDFKRAMSDIEQALKIDPQSAEAYDHLAAVTYLSTGKMNAALKLFDKAISIDPKYANAYFNRGAMRVRAREFKLALEDLNTAIKLNPHHANAYQNRAYVLELLDRKDDALRDYKTVAKLYREYGLSTEYVDAVIASLEKG